METDASGCGLGAVLEQEQSDGELHPVAYASRSLTPTERRYGVSELEALAVVWALKNFRAYLLGHETVVYTDHAALRSLLNTHHPSGKLARWGMAIQEISPEIRYRAGRKNGNADALSRVPLESIESESMITEMSRDSIKSTGTSNPVPIAVVDASSKAGASQTPSSETLGEVRMVLPEIAEEQRRDPYYSDVIRFMENGVLPEDEKVARRIVLSHPRLDLIDGVLCFVESRPPYRVRVAVPESYGQFCLQSLIVGVSLGTLQRRVCLAFW